MIGWLVAGRMRVEIVPWWIYTIPKIKQFIPSIKEKACAVRDGEIRIVGAWLVGMCRAVE